MVWFWQGSSIEHIVSASFCMNVEGGEWEERCVREFWSKYPAILSRIKTAAQPTADAWREFMKLLDSFEKSGKIITIISDNPAYDLTAIDYNLFIRDREFGVRYNKDGTGYRKVADPSERIKGVSDASRKKITDRLNKEFAHTHWAADDARHILATYFLVQDALRALHAPTTS